MGVTAAEEIARGCSKNVEGERTYTRTFRVRVTNPSVDDPLIALAAPGLPALRSTYSVGISADFGATLQDYTVSSMKQEGDFTYYKVVANYSTEDREQCDEAEVDDPLDEPPKIRFSFAQFSKPVDTTTDDPAEAIVNSAGQPFRSFPEIDDSRPVLVITRNEGAFDFGTAVDYKDAINSDTFFGQDPKTAKMQNISAVRKYRGSCAPFFEVTYEIQFNRDGWNPLKILDQGFYQLVDGAENTGDQKKKLQEILDDDGRKLTEPAKLDGNGKTLAEGEDPVFLEFDVYVERPFGALQLPGSETET